MKTKIRKITTNIIARYLRLRTMLSNLAINMKRRNKYIEAKCRAEKRKGKEEKLIKREFEFGCVYDCLEISIRSARH